MRKEWFVLILPLAVLLGSCGISGNEGPGGQIPKAELEIRGLQIAPTDSSAVIGWATTQEAVGTLSWGSGPTSLARNISSALGTTHSAEMTRLEPDSTYWFQITAATPMGARATLRAESFRTLPSADLFDTTPPQITEIHVVGITMDRATILWRTDDRSACSIHYGQTIAYGQVAPDPAPDTPVYARSHTITLTDLAEASNYHFRIQATNRAGLTTVSADGVFTTASRPILQITPDPVAISGGGEFTFAVSIANASNLAGLSFMLDYNENHIEILGVEGGAFWSAGDPMFPLMLESEDRTGGLVQYATSWRIAFQQDVPIGTLATGDGEVAIFTARTRGDFTTSTIDFITGDRNGDGVPESRLLDHNRLPLVFSARNGRVARN